MALLQVLCWVVVVAIGAVLGVDYDLTPASNWFGVLNGLKAGDNVVLHEGTYETTSQIRISIVGNITHPITIQGASGESLPVIRRPDCNQNVFNIKTGNYFTIKNVEFTSLCTTYGQIRGIVAETNVSNCVFDGIKVHGITSSAVTFNLAGSVYTNLTIINSEMYDTQGTAECLYLGGSSGNPYVSGALLENNKCHDTTNTDPSHGSGFQIKTGSHNVVLRNNVFWNNWAPCILFYDDWDRGQNIIENNICLGTHDNGIQVTAGALVRNNIIIGATSSGIAINANTPQPGKSPRNVQIIHNTIIGGSYGIYAGTTDSLSYAANNAIFGTTSALTGGGVPTYFGWYKNAFKSAVASYPANQTVIIGDYLTELQSTILALNQSYSPKATSALIGSGDTTKTTAYDHFGNARATQSTTIGAVIYIAPGSPVSPPGGSPPYNPPSGSPTPSPPPNHPPSGASSIPIPPFIMLLLLLALIQ